MKKQRVVVVCPGRGSYTKETLGYLKKYRPTINSFIENLDQNRQHKHMPTISELDNAATFSPSLHTRGENASTLIYACAAADFFAIDREKYEVVAVTGNSMGWYIACALGGALDPQGAFDVIDTMGSMMKDEIIGGQMIYPVVDENWRRDPAKEALVCEAMTKAKKQVGGEVYVSIFLGGYLVLGGNKETLVQLQKILPPVEHYPFILLNHAAFHTPLLRETSHRAFETLPASLFHAPQIPLVDGRGHIWQPYSTDPEEIYEYTLGHQVYDVYDFTKAIAVSLKEFLPDQIILLGPGNSLGGSIGQILIQHNWHKISSKQEFKDRQTSDPVLISMGL